ncbi:hypothetical protein Tco_1233623 [Tanacetum coccineum]
MENPRDKEFLASTSWADVQNMIRLACAFAPGAYTFHYESGDAVLPPRVHILPPNALMPFFTCFLVLSSSDDNKIITAACACFELWLEIIIEEASEGAEAGQRLALCKFILTNRTPIGGMKGKALSQLISIYKTVEGVEKDINIYLKTAHKSFKGKKKGVTAAGLICLKKHHFNAMYVGKSWRISQAYGMGQAMQVSGQDFLPYMAVVVPPLLRSAQLKPDVITSADSDNEIESDDER